MTLHFRSQRPPEGLARYRPVLTQPLSLDDCLRALRTICAESRKPTGGRPYTTRISESAEHGLASTLRSALVRSGVDRADVRAALPDLAQHAAGAARQRDHANPSEAASRARRALRLLTGLEPTSTKLDSPHLFMAKGFIELQTFAVRRQDRTKLVMLARTCAAMGAFDAPSVMPSIDALSAFVNSPASPYAGTTVRNATSTYRRIRAIAVRQDPRCATQFAALDRRPHSRSRVASVLDLGEPAASHDGTERLRWTAERLQDRYPCIATELRLFLETPSAISGSDAWRIAIQNAVLRAVSLLEVLYADHAVVSTLPLRTAIRLWHLYALDVPLLAAPTSTANAAFFRAVGELHGASGPLIQRLILDDAPHARRASALGGAEAGAAAWIPDVCVRNECALWSVVTVVYSRQLSLGDWAAQDARREQVMQWVHESKASPQERAGREIDKVWLVSHLSLPLLVCVGLTWMANSVRKARAEWQRCCAAGAPDDVCDASYRRYAFKLHDYCAVAIVCDDGMRRKNYTNALHGKHVTTTYEGGRLVAVGVWFGTDRASDPASLKMTERKRRSRRSGTRVQPHVHRLSAAGVDHELLDWWFREVAPGFTYQRPCVAPVLLPTSAALEGQRVFPSAPRTTRAARTGIAFAARVHEALYAVIRLLHGDAVPATRAQLSRAQRVACTLHRIRLLLTTYWGGVRGEWAYAEHLTTDMESTLKEHYNAQISAVMMDQLQSQLDDWRDPRHFDLLMDAIRARQDFAVADDPRVKKVLAARTTAMTHAEAVATPRRWRARRKRRAA